MQLLKNTLDYNEIRLALVKCMMVTLGLDQNHVIEAEGEAPGQTRPTLPYIDFKFTVLGTRYGDDTKQNVRVSNSPTTRVISSGPRKMTMVFNTFAKTHEEAYNIMMTWQAALDEETLQEYLRVQGIAVLIIGSVVDLSALLNTGYEGRANMDCQFGLTSNVTSDLGEIDTVVVEGAISTPGTVVDTNLET